MGGSSNPTPIGKTPGTGRGDPGPDDERCPKKLRAHLNAPAKRLPSASVLDLILDTSGEYPTVLLVDRSDGITVGSLVGIARLDQLVECLRSGVTYEAYVDAVDDGRVSLTILRVK